MGDRVGWRKAVERRQERLGRGDLVGDAMRRVVGIGGHLHGELPAGRQRSPPAAEHLGMIRHPLQAGVGDDQVVVTAARPLAEVAAGEAQPVVTAADRLPGRVEHRIRGIDADHLLDAEAIGDLGGELTDSAAEVDASTESAGAAAGAWRPGPRTAAPAVRRSARTGRDPSRRSLRSPDAPQTPLRHVRNLRAGHIPSHQRRGIRRLDVRRPLQICRARYSSPVSSRFSNWITSISSKRRRNH